MYDPGTERGQECQPSKQNQSQSMQSQNECVCVQATDDSNGKEDPRRQKVHATCINKNGMGSWTSEEAREPTHHKGSRTSHQPETWKLCHMGSRKSCKGKNTKQESKKPIKTMVIGMQRRLGQAKAYGMWAPSRAKPKSSLCRHS